MIHPFDEQLLVEISNRFEGDIRYVGYLIGLGNKSDVGSETNGGNLDGTDCVGFDFKGGRYARINCDRCALG